MNRTILTILIFSQAIIFKFLNMFYSRPVLILRRNINIQTNLNITHHKLLTCRPIVTIEKSRFCVETDSVDNEVRNAKHRLIQLKHLLVSDAGTINSKNLSELEAVRINYNENRGILDSYNYSEAISNIAHCYLRFSDTGEKINAGSNLDKILRILLTHVSNNPEYYFFVTNNHFINNARALLLGGLILRDEKYLSRGIQFLNIALKIFEENKVFRERSSHYHLIIFMWLNDILCILNQLKIDKLNKITSQIDSLITVNEIVTKSILGHSQKNIPLIGDISPDESPSFTSKFSYVALRHRKSRNSIKPVWLNYGGWITYKGSLWSVICCPQDSISLNYPTHGHDDWGSFCLSKNNKDILIDTGRYSYSNHYLSDNQIRRAGHNTISIELDGKNIIGNKKYFPDEGVTSRKIIIDDKKLSFTEFYKKNRKYQGQWKREVSIEDESFVIIDRISFSRSCKVVLMFYFSKEWYDKYNSTIVFETEDESLEIEKEVVDAKISKEYLSISKAVRLMYSAYINKPTTFKMSIT